MSNKLQGWLAPNTLTEDPNDRILVLNSAGTVDNEQLYEEMREEDTGLRRETLVHVVTLYERIVARALMNGHNVNTGLFYAVPRFIGSVEDGQWNPAKTTSTSHSLKTASCAKKYETPKLKSWVKKLTLFISPAFRIAATT